MTACAARAAGDSGARRLYRPRLSRRRRRRLGSKPALYCFPACTCRARRSANSSSTTAARPASARDELDALMRAGTEHQGARQPAVRRIFAHLDPDRHQRAGRRTGVARARHRALARHDHRGQLRRPHAQHHRRAVADQCRRAQQGGGAAQRHHGLASRRADLRRRQSRARAGFLQRRPRLGQIGGAKTWRANSASNASTARTLEALARATARARLTCSTCAIRPNTPPAICPARSRRPAGNWCRRPTSMPARSAPASS